MGESERYQDYKHIRKKKKSFTLGSEGNALMNLFVFNVVFFLLLMTIQVTYYFFRKTPADYQNEVLPWFSLPGGLIKFSERPWTLFTYMFSDSSATLMRLIGNMLWLWSFGSIFQQLIGNDKLFPVYLYGGIVGGILYIASHYIFPGLHLLKETSGILGANPAVLAIAAAVCLYEPRHRILTHIGNGIPLYIFFILYLFIDVAGIYRDHAGIILSHIGGLAAGALFVVLLQKGKDGSVWMNRVYHRFMHMFDPATNTRKANKTASNETRFATDEKSIKAQRVDELLDKINRIGFENLTAEEKDFLKKAAED